MLRSRVALLAFLTLFGALCAAGRKSELLQAYELKTLDWRFRRFPGADRKDAGVALLMLDQQSLDLAEADGVYWPWPRGLYEAVLDFCKAGGARAVVFDALFTSPSPYGRFEDAAFAESLKKNGGAVLAMEMGKPRAGHNALPPERFGVKLAGDASGAAVERHSARLPVSLLLGAAGSLGDVAAGADPDGVYRRLALLSRLGERHYPTLAAAAVLAASRDKTVRVDGNEMTLGDYRLPLTDGRLLLRFHGPLPFRMYPLGRVLKSWQNIQERQSDKGDLAPQALKDKIVLIGFSAPGLMDLRPSPVSEKNPGTDIVAVGVDNILSGDFLRPVPRAWAWALIALAVAGGAAAALALEGAWSAGAAALLSATLAAAALLLFTRGIWLDMVLPQLSLWLSFTASVAYGYATEGRKKREIHKAFARYLAPEVVDEIAKDPEKLTLGGERRELTCYFSDIEGFTTISEGLPPDRLTYLMNRYLGEMTDTILHSGGTLDKYIGDAIMAFWGAPVARPDHALTACRVALENQAKLVHLRRALEAEGFPPVRARIGLNSGHASVGNMGSAVRFSYTAMGDDINLASRLEGANKVYGSYLLISESTRAQAGGAIETRELDMIKVKGKNAAVKVYELLGLAGQTEPALLEKARRFEEALALYRARRWERAAAAFSALLPDAAAALYVDRCKTFMDASPAEDWDGSFALTEK